ncbi:MAG: hypothetical protein L6R37_003675 [Teloschistes peruensis]|nr:MAG: hypothetical protein L6R37_003675 [Teloschistes peruensis]
MAAALSALNAKIRSQPVLNYVCSTRKLALRDFTNSQGRSLTVNHSYGGREEALKLQAQQGAQTIQKEGKNILQQGEEKLKEVKDKVVR